MTYPVFPTVDCCREHQQHIETLERGIKDLLQAIKEQDAKLAQLEAENQVLRQSISSINSQLANLFGEL
jgi:septal ring factor EnvC (AmiA/AmiB activator)